MASALYDTDIVAWTEQQASALRALASSSANLTNAVDWENLIEEVESLGRSQVAGVEAKLRLLLIHLLKRVSAPDSPPIHAWRTEAIGFQIAARKTFTPSMRQRIDWDDLWRSAVKQAEASLIPYGDALARGLPARSPFRPEELVSRDFDLDAALLKIINAMAQAGGPA